MDTEHCILGNFLVVPTFVCKDARDPSGKWWDNLSKILFGNFAEMTASSPFMYMFLATNLRQVTDGDIEFIS
jgi:formate/nitrite transporter FocA (FNT family)